MKLPHITAPSNALQALFNLITTLWSRFLGDRMDPVALPSELAGLRVEAGTRKRVSALRCDFIYDPASALAADGITVIASTIEGRWIRQETDANAWGNQAAWHIDPAGGNDLSHGGTAATALQTWRELSRRTGMSTSQWTVRLPVVVTIHNDMLATDVIDGRIEVTDAGQLDVVGSRVAVGSHTTTAWSTFNATKPYSVTADWASPAAYVGSLLEFTSGPATGHACFIGKDAGGLVAWTGTVGTVSADGTYTAVAGATLPTAAGGDTFTVYDLPVVYVNHIIVSASRFPWGSALGHCMFRYLNMGVEASSLDKCYIEETSGADVGYLFIAQSTLSKAASSGVRFQGAHLTQSYMTIPGAGMNMYSGVLLTNGLVAAFWGETALSNDGMISIGMALLVGWTGRTSSLTCNGCLGVFDVPAATWYTPIEIRTGGEIFCSREVLGVNPEQTYGMKIQQGGQAHCGNTWPAQIPTIAGTSGTPLNIDGRLRTWSEVPYVDPRWGSCITDNLRSMYAPIGNPDVMHVAGAVTAGGVAPGGATFLLPNGTEQLNAVPGTTLPNIGYVVANTGVLQNLRVRLDAVAPAGGVPVTVWRVPAGSTTPAATAVTVTVPAGSREATSGAVFANVMPGDMLVIQHLNPGGSGVAYLTASVEVA